MTLNLHVALADLVLNPFEVNDYFRALDVQKSRFPFYPKLNYDIPFINSADRSYPPKGTIATQSVDYLNTVINETWEYTGIFDIDFSAYEEDDNTLYYQYVFTRLNSQTSLSNWKYAYIPINTSNTTALANANLLPSINFYDASTLTYGKKYPTEVNLYRAQDINLTNAYLVNIEENYTHPFLPNFYFTGATFIVNKQIIYEYIDSKGFYDIPYTHYLSPLRPIGLILPLGRLEEHDVDTTYMNNCYPNSKLNKEAPEYLEYIEDVPPILESIGTTTNIFYSFNSLWFQYKGEPNLLQSPPHPNARTLAQSIHIIEGQSITALNLESRQVKNNQNIYISQTSDSNEESLILGEVTN